MPRPKVFTVGLSAADREFLVKLTTTGVHPARMIMRSRVLLELDENAGPVPDQVVVAARAVTSTTTVRVVARRFAETGGDILATIGRKPRETPPVAPIVTGDVEARLIKLACSSPPEAIPVGRCGCWSVMSPCRRICPTWTTPPSAGC